MRSGPRRRQALSSAPGRRRGPIGAAPDDVLVGHIRRVLEASPFHGEGYRKVWAKLRVAGVRTAKERVLINDPYFGRSWEAEIGRFVDGARGV